MSDISTSFPPWVIAWALLSEATPFITLVLLSVATACFFTRGTGRMRHVPASDVMPAYDWRTFVPGRRGIGSRLTQRWRKADSNRWSPLEK